ncbi:hypothetical protein CVT25_009218 [Psilocybe cyanescens]|uniref:Uncharacterized protein n=1 Tax=Psilocybe cyanescens TaxID=93625 RepID=A0A409WWF0_PSICY|nr:hypothetical protein CVT25_009218 [Psilocybe cyanescens]
MTLKFACTSFEDGLVRIKDPGRGLDVGGPKAELDNGELSMTADADCRPYEGWASGGEEGDLLRDLRGGDLRGGDLRGSRALWSRWGNLIVLRRRADVGNGIPQTDRLLLLLSRRSRGRYRTIRRRWSMARRPARLRRLPPYKLAAFHRSNGRALVFRLILLIPAKDVPKHTALLLLILPLIFRVCLLALHRRILAQLRLLLVQGGLVVAHPLGSLVLDDDAGKVLARAPVFGFAGDCGRNGHLAGFGDLGWVDATRTLRSGVLGQSLSRAGGINASGIGAPPV